MKGQLLALHTALMKSSFSLSLPMSSSVLSLLPADMMMPTHQDCACVGIIISAGSKESTLLDMLSQPAIATCPSACLA